MTSLSSQLQSLRTATAQHQTVERRHVSLLFARKEAETLDRETVYNIGCAGLRKLKQLDPEIAAHNDLFDESRLHFQRSMITNEENLALNEKIEKLLFQLSPYVEHFACQQVLEWLVFRYQASFLNTNPLINCVQIYAYNAESMILTFLPFHETNFFGRMLSILEYNFSTSKDWAFLEGFCKKEYPVPFSALVGEEFLEKRCHMLFTFYTKLLIAVLEESTKIDDMLLAKIIPLIAIGLKSSEERSLFTARVISLLVKMLTSPGKYKLNPADLQMDFVDRMMRSTHSHHVLRESLRLLTAAVRLSPSTVTSHVMSVFTFMGSGLFRKDNELTLKIIEDTIEALFLAICEEDGKTLPTEMRIRLANVTRILAASTCDIPAHRRSRMAHAIGRAVKHINVWIVAGVLVEHFCSRWQRSAADAAKRSAEQDAFDDFALELCAGLDPVYQFSAITDLVNFIVRLGGDQLTHTQEEALDKAVFDRNKYSLPKLRHFRFMVLGLVIRILSNRQLFEKVLSKEN
ncbi:hypothetical protein COOONC_11464 [Cooperia oncophora]